MPGPRPITRIGLLGDIHAEDAALAVAIRHLEEAAVDLVVAVGDIADGPGSVDRCCELLASAGVSAVRGNHERWFLAGTMRDLPDATGSVGHDARAFLAGLPPTRRFQTAAGDLMLCHGLGDDDMASVEEGNEWAHRFNAPLGALILRDEPLVVINGHTHRRLVWSHRRLTVINAGTLFRDHDPCFAVADLAEREVTYFDLGPGGRVTRGEPVPIPPPLGGRR